MFHNLLNSILKKKLYLFITVFVVLVVGISLGSAILTKTLSIGGKTKIQNNWIIYFDKVVLNNNSVKNEDTSKDAKIVDFEKQNIEFSANLSSINDFYEFDVYTVNDGNVDAMIDSIELTGLDGNEEYINYDVNYDDATLSDGDEYYSNKYTYSNDKLKPCDPLYGETRRKIKVRISLKKELEDDAPISLHLGFKINYVQYDDTCALKHTLTIDPNGGMYNNRLSNTQLRITSGTQELIKVPVKGDQEFLGWDVTPSTGTYTFDPTNTSEQQFTMGDEDVILRARWSEEGDFVARIENTYYKTIQKAFDDVKDKNWTDNTVHLLKDTTEYPTNSGSKPFKFDLGTHTVTGMITNSSNSNITLINGKIVADTNDEQAITNYGILSLGIDDGSVEVENTISIRGNKVGISNHGNNAILNFYDGYIETIISDGEDGTTYSFDTDDDSERVFTPNNYSIVVDSIENGQRAYVTRDPNRKVVKTTTNGTIFYANLQDAINAVNYQKKAAQVSGKTIGKNFYKIYAIRDFNAPYTITVSDTSDIYFDLVGYDISFGDTITIEKKDDNIGSLNILNSSSYIDTSDRAQISVAKPITNNGNLNISDINLDATTDQIIIVNNNKLDLIKTTINGKDSYGVNNSGAHATINMDEDTIIKSQNNYGLYNNSDSLVIDNGTIYALINNGTMELNDGVTVRDARKVSNSNDKLRAVRNYANSVLTINGANIISEIDSYAISNSGNIYFNSGNINSSYNGIVQEVSFWANSNFYMSGGEIHSKDSSITQGKVIITDGLVHSINSGTLHDTSVELNGGTIKCDNGNAIEIYNFGNAVINNGTIEAKNNGIVCSRDTIYFNGGNINAGNYAISESGSYTKVYITDGTLNGKIAGINTSSELEVTGGTINGTNPSNENSTSIGIIINSGSNTRILGGLVQGDLYGVQNNANLTLGEDDENINSDTPVIIGDTYGLYITSNVTNFYDGILKGITDGYYGTITGLPIGAVIGEGTDIIDEKEYQTDYVEPYENWLRVGDKEFNNINAASKEIDSVGTIEVIKDANISFPQIFIDNETENKRIIFDLAGHKITTTQTVTNNVNLTIIDSSEDNVAVYTPTINTGFLNNKKLTLSGGKYVSSIERPFDNVGEMIVENATFDVTNNAIYNRSLGNLTINNISIKNSKNGIYNYGTLTINDGTINATDIGVWQYRSGSSTTMNGGKIIAKTQGIGGEGNSVTINNGEVKSTNGDAIYSYHGSIKINNGTITSEKSIGVEGASGITINGGEITGTTGVKNLAYRSGNLILYFDVVINDGTITGTNTYGLHTTGGDTYIYGGKVSGETDGLYNLGTTQIGRNDGNISKTSPEIIGKQYGVNTQGYLKFFDGILKGITEAHTGLISEIPDGTMVKNDTDDIDDVVYKTEYIVKYGNWLRVGEQEFNSINEAASVIEDTGTMVVIANPYIGFMQEIPSGKNITFDLNGHSLIMTQPIEVNGSLNIVDSTATGDNLGGSISGLRSEVIINNGSLTIDKGIYSSETGYTLQNEGTFILNNGSFLSKNNYSIYNTHTFTMNNGTINTYGGIYNVSNAEFTMNNGYINTTGMDAIKANGTVTINDGIINSSYKSYDSFGTINVENGLLTINGGSISTDAYTAISVSTGSSSSRPRFIINDGHIIGKKYGVFVNDSFSYGDDFWNVKTYGGLIETDETGIYCSGLYGGKILLIDGEINSGVYGVKVDFSNGKLNIGENDGTISDSKPTIAGDLYAITGGGIFNFYDGILKGNVNGDTDAYSGELHEIPDRSELLYGSEGKYQTTLRLVPEMEKAVNLQTDKRYTNFQEALDEALEGETVQVLCDFSLFYEVNNTNTNNFTLDMNGHKIITNKRIVNGGNLSIINSSDNEAALQTKSNINLIKNTSKLSLNNIRIIHLNNSNTIIDSTGELLLDNVNMDVSNLPISNSGKLTVLNSTILTTGYNGYAISNSTRKDVTIDNCTLTGYASNGYNTTNITNTTFTGRIEQNNGTLNISDSIINGYFANRNNANTTFNNVKLYNTSSYYITSVITNDSNCTFNFINSEINVDKTKLANLLSKGMVNYGTMNVSGSDINVGNYYLTSENNEYEYMGIQSATGTLNINNTNINVKGGTTSYGINSTDNAITNIYTADINVSEAKNAYGINASKGTVIIGEDDGVVYSEKGVYENPKIYASGSQIGIGIKKVNGSIGFFDGIVYGSSNSIPETVTNIAYPYEVTTYIDKSTGYQYSVLENINNDYQGTAVALLNGLYYMKVQDAINKANNGDEIKLLQSTTEDLIIDDNKDIIINLNGKDITTTIDNNGKLRVYNGLLQNVDKTVVNNNGTFIMGTNDGNISSTSVRVVSEVTALKNNGTFIMYDGYVEGNEPIDGIINEKAEQSKIYTSVEEQSIIKYIQSMSEESIINGTTDLILYINPNGGTYDGSTDIKEVSLKHNNTYTLNDPIKDNAIFDKWEADIDGVLVEDIVTMNLSDVVVTAKWLPNSNAVAEINGEYYASISDALSSANEGDTIKVLKDVTEDIVVDKNIVINLDNHTLTSLITNNSMLQLINGTVENTNNEAIINNGTLILGDNDGTVNTDSIKVIGNAIGIKQNGTLKYYDGSVEGVNAVDGNVDSLPDGYYLSLETNDGKQKISLIETSQDAVAAIDNNGSILYFNNIDSAIETAKIINKEIFILKDFEGINSITIGNEDNISINLNGHNIILSSDLINNGTLTIRDKSNTSGSVSFTKTMQNNSVLNIENVELKQMTNNNTILNNGTLNVNGGKISAKDGYAVNNTGNLSVINNGEIIANKYSLYNNSSNDITLNSGKFTGIYSLTNLTLGGDIEIDSTSSNNSCIYLKNSNTSLIINSGTYISKNYCVQLDNNNQNLEINGGNFTSDNQTIYSYRKDSSNILITDGIIKSNNLDGIMVDNSNSTTTITGGQITGKTIGVNIYNGSSVLNITGGEITNTVDNYDNYALYSRGTCNISGTVKIMSEKASAIRNAGTMNISGGYIYSGALKGYGIYDDNILNISGDTKIETVGSSSFGIYINTRAQNVIDNIDLKSDNIGIYLYYGDSKLDINGGKIDATVYGINQRTSNSILNIGNKDDELSINNPYITGGLYGLYKTSGTTNYYNGRLRGSVNGYTGEFNNIRTSKDIIEELENGDTVKNLVTYSTTNAYEQPVSDSAKKGNGSAKITYIGDTSCSMTEPNNYLYSGIEVEFKTPCTGKYRLEVWGAQGGTYDNYNYGGYGGYSTGEIDLTKDEILYINVGGQGTITSSTLNSVALGGYNGGGDAINSDTRASSYSGSGGGATSIATTSGLLSGLENRKDNILIVAGGGSGIYNGEVRVSGASAGGYKGNDGISENYHAKGATQTDGYAFGKAKNNNTPMTPGAGAGYYSGYSGQYVAGAGSGYIGNDRLENAYMYGYNVSTSNPSYINNYLVNKEDYLQVGDETYNSISSAVNAIDDTGTILVIKDAKMQEKFEVDSDKDITLDLNGHDVTITETITNNGKLTIKDSSNNKHSINNLTGDLITNTGDLTIENIELNSKGNTIKLNTTSKNILLDGLTINSGGKLIDTSSASNTTVGINNSTISSAFNTIDINQSTTNTININNSNLTTSDEYVLYLNRVNYEFKNSKFEEDNWRSTIYLSNSTGTINNCEITDENGTGLNISSTNLDIYNSIVSAKSSGITIGNDSNVTINGNTNISSNDIGIYLNGNNSFVTMNNGKIESNKDGVYVNFNYGTTNTTFNIYGGEIHAKQKGINLNVTDSKANIGNPNEEISIETPVIVSDEYALYSSKGIFNFYSGRLKSKSVVSNVDFTSVRKGYETYETFDFEIPGNMDTKYTVNYLVEKEGFLKVGNNNYSSFEDAIKALGEEKRGTITVLNDVLVQEEIDFDGNDIVLDLNGHILTTQQTLTNSGKLTIKDSTNTEGTIYNKATIGFINTGNLIVDSGTIKAKGYAIKQEDNDAILTINGGNIISTKDTAIYMNLSTLSSEDRLIMTGGNVVGVKYALYGNRLRASISGAHFESSSTSTNESVIYMYNSNISMDGNSSIYSETTNGINVSWSDFDISNTSIDIRVENRYGLYVYGSEMNVRSGTNITSKGDGIDIYRGSTVKIYDCDVNADIGIYISDLDSQSRYLYMYGGKVNGTTYGIYQKSGEMYLGDSNTDVNNNNPNIKGNTYGIYKSSGKLYFDNGITSGLVDSMYGYEDSARSGYFVKEESGDDNYINSYLDLLTKNIVNTTTNEEYYTLMDAINSANQDDTLLLTGDVTNYDEITLAASKKIIIDLNGYNINTSKAITNNGDLTIENNSQDTSKFVNYYSGYALFNRNIMNINNVDIESYQGIENRGTLNVNNSNIKCNIRTIDNSSTATITNSKLEVLSNSGYNVYSIRTLVIENTDILYGNIWANTTSSNISITGGTINNSNISNSGSLTINGTTLNYERINTNGNTNEISNSGTFTLSNSTLNYTDKTTIKNSNWNTILLSNYGTLNSTSNIYTINYQGSEQYNRKIRCISNSKILNSTSDTFNVSNALEGYGIYNEGSNESTIRNMTTNIQNNNKSYGIYNNGSNTLNIYDSSISIENSVTSYGMYINKGTVKLYDGNILSNGDTSYGILLADGTLELGENDNNVKVDTPYIKSVGITSGYGIYMNDNTDIFNFYDGYIMGSTSPKNDNVFVNSRPTGYKDNVKFDNETGYNYIILEEE